MKQSSLQKIHEMNSKLKDKVFIKSSNWFELSNTVVEYLTHKPKIEESNPTTNAGREKKAKKNITALFFGTH
jgi:hypothetical protein